MTPPGSQCPVCGRQLPARDRANGGRTLRYCSGACKAKAYRARRQADGPAGTNGTQLPPGARHARAIEIRRQISELAGALADTASGQQTLFATPAVGRRTRPADTGRTLHQLIAELTTLAIVATVTKHVTNHRTTAGPPSTASLLDKPGSTGK
jgi:hypothetical protein